jgi:hypothetical protein
MKPFYSIVEWNEALTGRRRRGLEGHCDRVVTDVQETKSKIFSQRFEGDCDANPCIDWTPDGLKNALRQLIRLF